jgi:hypothetical protein
VTSMVGKRTAFDGAPFYCIKCDADPLEQQGCKRTDCALESASRAKDRQRRQSAKDHDRQMQARQRRPS